MANNLIHPSIAAKYEVTAGFAQVILIPKLGVRDLAVTPLHVVDKHIQAGKIKGLQEIQQKEVSKSAKK